MKSVTNFNGSVFATTDSNKHDAQTLTSKLFYEVLNTMEYKIKNDNKNVDKNHV